MSQATSTSDITIPQIKEKIWAKAFSLTVQIEYAKGREKTKLLAKYEALKEVWEMLGGNSDGE